MRFYKILACILLPLMLLIAMWGCQLYRGPYTFRQEQSNIEKIEVCSFENKSKTITPLVCLSESEEEQLLLKMSGMECFEYSPGDHPREYGEAVICIHYINQEIEVIGITNVGWVSPDGEWELSSYSFDWEEMRNLILDMVGEDDLPELRA